MYTASTLLVLYRDIGSEPNDDHTWKNDTCIQSTFKTAERCLKEHKFLKLSQGSNASECHCQIPSLQDDLIGCVSLILFNFIPVKSAVNKFNCMARSRKCWMNILIIHFLINARMS